MFDVDGARRKLLIFTEHRDTMNYLVDRLRAFLGSANAVVCISGSTPREERRTIQGRFTQDESCLVLVATDAAGEGINLQRAHLVINYDLPWNPNRIEQRFGRVHRIGQTEVCHKDMNVLERNHPGYDVRSVRHRHDDQPADVRHIEVKGRIAGGPTVTVSRNEILTSMNEPDRFVLALVEVSPHGGETVRYLRRPFDGRSEEFVFEVTSVNFTWSALWECASEPS